MSNHCPLYFSLTPCINGHTGDKSLTTGYEFTTTYAQRKLSIFRLAEEKSHICVEHLIKIFSNSKMVRVQLNPALSVHPHCRPKNRVILYKMIRWWCAVCVCVDHDILWLLPSNQNSKRTTLFFWFVELTCQDALCRYPIWTFGLSAVMDFASVVNTYPKMGIKRVFAAQCNGVNC